MSETLHKPALYDLTLQQLMELLAAWGEPAYRARQIYRQLYVKLTQDPMAMTDLPLALRQRLAQETELVTLRKQRILMGDEGMTRKVLFALPDGSPVESVLMVYAERATVCVSSQSGCPMACVFCATGKLGFLHDLTAGQIVEQVIWAARELRSPIHLESQISNLSNIVFMGMGEPFNNYQHWWAAVERLHDPMGFNMGARNFTVSTVGLVPGILKLAREKLQVNLAISLHAADDDLRTEMMPVNKRYPVAEVIAAAKEYTVVTGRRVSFEYVLLKEKNDLPEQAQQLADLLKDGPRGEHHMLCHVNLIPWNPVPGTPLGRSDRERVERFRAVLERNQIPCTVRMERGVEIGAACGQLAGAG